MLTERQLNKQSCLLKYARLYYIKRFDGGIHAEPFYKFADGSLDAIYFSKQNNPR